MLSCIRLHQNKNKSMKYTRYQILDTRYFIVQIRDPGGHDTTFIISTYTINKEKYNNYFITINHVCHRLEQREVIKARLFQNFIFSLSIQYIQLYVHIQGRSQNNGEVQAQAVSANDIGPRTEPRGKAPPLTLTGLTTGRGGVLFFPFWKCF